MNDKPFIPLSVPNICGNEWEYVKDCLDTGWISSVGAYVSRFEQMIAEYTGAKYAIATMNGTVALQIALMLANVRAGDYVLLPNLTFVASANAIKYLGAEPILIDADNDLWQMDLNLLEKFIDQETVVEGNKLLYKKNRRVISAIMPVHILGNIFEMDRFLSIMSKYPIAIVEDATEALGSFYKGRHAGCFSQIGCFSFNGNKIISTGGGGMIVTDDETLAKKAKHLTTTAKASADEYYHDEVGYNYRLVNVLAAIGVGQMEQFPKLLERKMAIVNFYKERLADISDIGFQKNLDTVLPNGWLFTIQTSHQEKLLEYLNQDKILCRKFWMPMNHLPMYNDCVFYQEEDISRKIYDACISIPSSTNITNEELERVSAAIHSFYQNL